MRHLILPLAVLFICLPFFSCKTASKDPVTIQKEPLEELLDGNKRFASQHAQHPHQSGNRLKEIETGQHPVVAVICCSDSRVPPELIFDQGLGDLFVVRTAGNLLGGLEIGSIEYAVEHLGVKEVLVMGHSGCGAIKAFLEGGESPGHIREIVDSIRSEQEIRSLSSVSGHLLDRCVRANILHASHQLRLQSPILAEKMARNELRVTAACYDLKDAVVEIIRE